MNTQTNTPFTDALAASHLAALQELQTQLTDPAATRAERRLAASAILRIRPPTPPRERQPAPPKADADRAALRRDLTDMLTVTSRLMAAQSAQPAARRLEDQPAKPLPGRTATPTNAPPASRAATLASAAGSTPATPTSQPPAARPWTPADPLPTTWPAPASNH